SICLSGLITKGTGWTKRVASSTRSHCTATYTSKLGPRCPMINGDMQRGPSAMGATGYAPCCPMGRTRSCPMGTCSGPAGHHGTEPRLRHRAPPDGHTLAAPPPVPPLRVQ
ncbi:hypothetical protein PIB30_114240, partial [Stylosanthes scabra]|nr:hypothetical protein [Stylosanthes scabra]